MVKLKENEEFMKIVYIPILKSQVQCKTSDWDNFWRSIDGNMKKSKREHTELSKIEHAFVAELYSC